MHLGTFNEGDKIPLTIVFQNSIGADTPATNPTVEIIYIDNNGMVQYALQPAPMQKRSANISGDYFYLFTVPAGFPHTKYFVNYKATVDGVSTTGEDSFNVSYGSSGGGDDGGGSALLEVNASTADLDVKDRIGNPMGGVLVTFYSRFDGRQMAQAFTDMTGGFTVYLPAGSYLVNYRKDGWIAKTVEFTL
jgi:hypothetical protein